MGKSYKDLIVWRKSLALVKIVYQTTKEFPKDEVFGLISQMRRSAVSIASNIAEGACRGTKKDYVQFLRVALGSAAELETQLIVSFELGYVEKYAYVSLVECITEVSKMINAMIKKFSN
jgi:four helix bundle protein